MKEVKVLVVVALVAGATGAGATLLVARDNDSVAAAAPLSEPTPEADNPVTLCLSEGAHWDGASHICRLQKLRLPRLTPELSPDSGGTLPDEGSLAPDSPDNEVPAEPTEPFEPDSPYSKDYDGDGSPDALDNCPMNPLKFVTGPPC